MRREVVCLRLPHRTVYAVFSFRLNAPNLLTLISVIMKLKQPSHEAATHNKKSLRERMRNHHIMLSQSEVTEVRIASGLH